MTSFTPDTNNDWKDRQVCSCKIQGQCMCYALQECSCSLDCVCEDCDDMQTFLIVNEEDIILAEGSDGCPCGGNCQCGQLDIKEEVT